MFLQLNLQFNCDVVRFRYPLIIDPSGQATEYIMNEYKDRKITRTSFLDDAFRKNLESALRFGNPLLVQVRAVILIPPDLKYGCTDPCFSLLILIRFRKTTELA